MKINQDEIIVQGGRGKSVLGNRRGYLYSSEIYNHKQRSWRKGPDLPKGLNVPQLVVAKPGLKYLGYFLGSLYPGDYSVYGFNFIKSTRCYSKIIHRLIKYVFESLKEQLFTLILTGN